MPVDLYVDVQIPASIVDDLRQRDLDVLSVQEDGRRKKGDEKLLRRATTLGRLLVTFDDDFLRIASRQMQEERDFAGIAFADQNQISIGQAIRDLEVLAKTLSNDEVQNRVFYLPL